MSCNKTSFHGLIKYLLCFKDNAINKISQKNLGGVFFALVLLKCEHDHSTTISMN